MFAFLVTRYEEALNTADRTKPGYISVYAEKRAAAAVVVVAYRHCTMAIRFFCADDEYAGRAKTSC